MLKDVVHIVTNVRERATVETELRCGRDLPAQRVNCPVPPTIMVTVLFRARTARGTGSPD
jgi:hypothetical protein